MAKHITTTATLPPAMQEKYEIVGALEGGPVFDLPNYRQYGVDFSKLEEAMAETLIKRKWPHLRRKEAPAAPAVAPAPEPAPAIEDTTAPETKSPRMKHGGRE